MNQPPTDSNPLVLWIQQGNRPFLLGISLMLIAMIVFYTMNHQPATRMCRLFDDCEISNIERQRILLALGTAGLEGYEIENGQFLVPAAERALFLKQIDKHKALPRALLTDEGIQPNPLLPSSQLKRLELERKKQHVSNMILELPYVEAAMFEMDSSQSTTMFEPARQSSVVMVQAKNNATLTRNQAETIQQLVAAAFAGMRRDQVAIIDSNAGIGYQNLHDTEQSRLIEYVNWTRNRREYYLQQLSNLLRDYPGLQIEVEVERRQAEVDNQQHDKIASQRSEKLTSFSADRYESSDMGLNSRAEIGVPNQHAAAEPPRQDTVATVYHQAVWPVPPQQIAPGNESAVRPAGAEMPMNEAIRVTVRVPVSTLSLMELPAVDSSTTTKEKFQQLKKDIVSKIEHVIPASSLADSRPVTVLLMDTAVATKSLDQESSIARMVQLYWPVVCGLFLALFAVYWSRARNQHEPVVSGSTPVQQPVTEEDRLQKQLSNLIDKDPAAAAAVIKNWISQTD